MMMVVTSPMDVPLLVLLLLLAVHFAPTVHTHNFNLYIASDEMQRTLGISARMEYVSNGMVNEHAIRFPYQVAENVTHLRFTWGGARRNIRYSLRAVSDHFDVLPILHLSAEGFVPRKSQDFTVEYRCVGTRSGQFQVSLHFNISSRPPLRFTLKQEKICSSMEGRRSFSGDDDASHRPSLLDSSSSSSSSSDSSSSSFPPLPSLLLLFLSIGSLLLSLLLCSLLLWCWHCARAKDQKDSIGAMAGPMGPRPNAWPRRRRSTFRSLYTTSRQSLRAKLHWPPPREQQQRTPMTTTTTTTVTPMVAAAAASQAPNSGGAGGIHPTRTMSSLAVSDQSNSNSELISDGDTSPPVIHGHGHQQQMPNSLSDPQLLMAMPSTSTAPFPTSTNGHLTDHRQLQKSLLSGRIWFENARAQRLDISQALVELNADRNLFEQAPRAEMEGKYGAIFWANWRQIGATGQGAVVDEVDDQEDDAKEDKALICKTLKPDAGRTQFERFLRNALQFHHVPAHPHLAQVLAAATFGNFRNPNTVKDLPLICYAHDGFGLLKPFLHTCRNSPSMEEAEEEAERDGDGKAEAEGAEGPVRIVLTKTPSVQQQQQHRHDHEQQETTLRAQDLADMACQLCSGLCHLQKFGIVHKDIAARNCLVSRASSAPLGPNRRLWVQLCDSALGRDLFPDDYALPIPSSSFAASATEAEAEELTEPRPIRWMAPELLEAASTSAEANPAPSAGADHLHPSSSSFSALPAPPSSSPSLPLLHPPPPLPASASPPLPFSSATDVWAFGVLLWELFTFGQQPYAELGPEEVVQALTSSAESGLLLRLCHPPYNCPGELYATMCQCWATAPEERPTAPELEAQLRQLKGRMGGQFR